MAWLSVVTPRARNCSDNADPASLRDLNASPLTGFTVSTSPWTSIASIRPLSIICATWLRGLAGVALPGWKNENTRAMTATRMRR
jgi:hypothetical protein